MYQQLGKILSNYLPANDSYHVEVKVSDHQGDKQQCSAFITAKNFIASIILWDTNELESEVIDNTGKRIHWEYCELDSISQMRSKVSAIVDLIKADPNKSS
jgi:hypothetical protein